MTLRVPSSAAVQKIEHVILHRGVIPVRKINPCALVKRDGALGVVGLGVVVKSDDFALFGLLAQHFSRHFKDVFHSKLPFVK